MLAYDSETNDDLSCTTSLGLETHPMDGFDHEAVKKEFNIPEKYWILLLLAVGYKQPDVECRFLLYKPFKGHRNKCRA
nr:nitroreductase family protein [Desulfobacula sp.]